MSTLELPKSFDDFVDARKAGFLHKKLTKFLIIFS